MASLQRNNHLKVTWEAWTGRIILNDSNRCPELTQHVHSGTLPASTAYLQRQQEAEHRSAHAYRHCSGARRLASAPRTSTCAVFNLSSTGSAAGSRSRPRSPRQHFSDLQREDLYYESAAAEPVSETETAVHSRSTVCCAKVCELHSSARLQAGFVCSETPCRRWLQRPSVGVPGSACAPPKR